MSGCNVHVQVSNRGLQVLDGWMLATTIGYLRFGIYAIQIWPFQRWENDQRWFTVEKWEILGIFRKNYIRISGTIFSHGENRWENDGKCIKHMIFGSIWDITVGDIQWPFQPGIEISMEPWSNMIVWDTLSSDHRIPQGTGIETGHLGKSWRKQGAFQWRHGHVQSSCVAEVQRWLTAPSKRAVHSRTSRCYNFPGVWLES